MRSATTSNMKWGEVEEVKEIEEQATKQLGVCQVQTWRVDCRVARKKLKKTHITHNKK